MFDHTDTIESKSGRVKIKDMSPESLKIFLDLLYTGIPKQEQRKVVKKKGSFCKVGEVRLAYLYAFLLIVVDYKVGLS